MKIEKSPAPVREREGRIVVKQQDLGYQNPAAGRFGDAAPRY